MGSLMSISKDFWKKIKNRFFVCEQILFYRFSTTMNQTSLASVYPASHENISDLLYFDTQHNLDIYHQFLARGDTGYLASIGKTCIHRSWVIHHPGTVWPHWALPMTLSPGEAYIHFCETAEDAKGKNIFAHVLSVITDDFLNCRNIYICVNTKNKASIRSIEKAGFQLVRKTILLAMINQLIYSREHRISSS